MQRAYAGAQRGRLTMTGVSDASADSELYTGLRTLRNRSRQLCRDVVYARRARAVVINNVIGAGVGMQAQVENLRGRSLDDVNSAIEEAFGQWCRADSCHTGGELHFSDLERAAMGEVFEAGEVILRKHYAPFGQGTIPLALELIEAERIADDFEIKPPPGALVTMGVEHDSFGRPLAYYIHSRHPRELVHAPSMPPDRILRVPAEEIVHLRVIERAPQRRGVPWLHAAITRLNQLGEFEEAAVIAARIGASKVGFFEQTEPDAVGNGDLADGNDANGTPTMDMEAGEFQKLPYGYRFDGWDPTYPNEVFDPFVRSFLRGIASGIEGLSYEALSGDFSQSNYSSSRLGQLSSRDAWRVLQQWWVRSFREPLHREWLRLAVMSRAVTGIDVQDYAINAAKYEAVKFKPRGWSWVDPTKEVEAQRESVRCGFTTVGDVIAMSGDGKDLEDVLKARKRELDLMGELNLVFDTDPTVAAPSPVAKTDTPAADPQANAQDGMPPTARPKVVPMKREQE